MLEFFPQIFSLRQDVRYRKRESGALFSDESTLRDLCSTEPQTINHVVLDELNIGKTLHLVFIISKE